MCAAMSLEVRAFGVNFITAIKITTMYPSLPCFFVQGRHWKWSLGAISIFIWLELPKNVMKKWKMKCALHCIHIFINFLLVSHYSQVNFLHLMAMQTDVNDVCTERVFLNKAMQNPFNFRLQTVCSLNQNFHILQWFVLMLEKKYTEMQKHHVFFFTLWMPY